MRQSHLTFFLLTSLLTVTYTPAKGQTYAERLGWGADDRVVIFHADDLGMHRHVNLATIKTIEEGVVTSTSTMMPTPWVTHWANYLAEHPTVDNGLHLTLNAEWDEYRWVPLSGVDEVPGLVDEYGYLHRDVQAVAMNATPDEVEREIRAQISMARRIGMPVTHLDTHMGALASRADFYERFVQIAIEEQIPILAVGGHGTQARQQWPEAADVIEPFMDALWEAGLPLIDDLDMRSYRWDDFESKKEGIIQSLREMRPGITQIIVHPALPGDDIANVLRSVDVRHNDYRVMVHPDVKRVLEEERIILTTWRELMNRRQALRDGGASE